MLVEFKASARYIRCSPYKLRPLADVVRGKSAEFGLGFLTTCGIRRASFIKKLIDSAVANARFGDNSLNAEQLTISELKVDQGPTFKYFKPGAMGRSNIYKKRLSHINIVLKKI